MIIDRLPYGLKLKWHDVADRITETEEREITIKDVSDSVTSKARVATHAIFGTITKDNQVPPRGTKLKNKLPPTVSSFGANVGQQLETRTSNNANSQKCPLCNA